MENKVQVNGLDIGRISDIGHHRREDGSLTARVTLRIGDQYTIYKDARVKKVAESLLGDYRLDLIWVIPALENSSPAVSSLKSKACRHGCDQSELRDIASNVNKVTQSLATVLSDQVRSRASRVSSAVSNVRWVPSRKRPISLRKMFLGTSASSTRSFAMLNR